MSENHLQGKKACPLSVCKNSGVIISSVVCLALGLALGYFVFGGGFNSALAKTTLSESELNAVVATFNYNGKHTVTAKDVLESTGSLDRSKDQDGNYMVPSAESIVGYVRNQVLIAAAKAEGIEVTDEDVANFLQNRLGVKEVKDLVSQTGMDEETLKKMVHDSALTEKLLSKKTEGKNEVPGQAPEMPAQPEKGKENEATEAYAEYIKGLVGDAWDSENAKWSDENSDLAKAFTGENEFNGKTATYQQATMAYYTISSKYQQAQADASKLSTDYINELFSNTTIELKTLAN